MSHTVPRKLDIERLIAGELDSERKAELEAHLEECIACKDYYMSLEKERATFLRVYPYSEIAAFSAKKQKKSNLFSKLFDFTSRPVLVPVFASLLFVAVLLPVVMYQRTAFVSDSTNFKGGTILTFACMRNGSTFQGDNNYRINDNDRVQIFYSSDKDGYVSLISLDESATVSFYQPDEGSDYCSVKAARGTGIAFPGSIQFGKVSGDELVVLIKSESMLKTEEIKKWAQEAVMKTPDLTRLAQKIKSIQPAENCVIYTLLLKKG